MRIILPLQRVGEERRNFPGPARAVLVVAPLAALGGLPGRRCREVGEGEAAREGA